MLASKSKYDIIVSPLKIFDFSYNTNINNVVCIGLYVNYYFGQYIVAV